MNDKGVGVPDYTWPYLEADIHRAELRGATWATHDHMWPFFAKNIADNYLTREEYEGMVAKAASRIVDDHRARGDK